MRAPRAAEIGLITKAVPDAEVMSVATQTAEELSAKRRRPCSTLS
jgi:enoyl-CoA hydratase/carnithine racemase